MKSNEQMRQYDQLAQKYRPKPNVLWNCVKAFVVGGFICALGQGLQMLYHQFFGFNLEVSSNLTVVTLIFIACMLTGLGVYDNIGQWAGAGTAVPVTGFANAISSAALEHKAEGYVLGVGGNMFKVAGSVIVFGVIAAFFISLIRSLFWIWINN